MTTAGESPDGDDGWGEDLFQGGVYITYIMGEVDLGREGP
jgi:hypothetical protein